MTATPVGTLRRLQALAVLGWSTRVLGTRLHCDPAHLDAILAGTATPTQTLATTLADAYEPLSGRPGPCTTTRDHARDQQWAAPLLWHDLDIDHPATTPVPDPPTPTPRRIHLDDIHHWLGLGCSLDNLAKRIGVQTTSLHRVLEREQTKAMAVDHHQIEEAA